MQILKLIQQKWAYFFRFPTFLLMKKNFKKNFKRNPIFLIFFFWNWPAQIRAMLGPLKLNAKITKLSIGTHFVGL